MELLGSVIEASRGVVLVVAVAALSYAAQRPSPAQPARTANRDRVDSVAVSPLSGVGWERELRSDGRGGWYAVVAVAGRSEGPPRGGIDEYYGLQIVGTRHRIELAVIDELVHWWLGDRFVAHLIPSHSGDADLQVVGLIPIELGDTSTLDEIASGRRPMPRTERGWPREWHELVIAEVTPGRRWRTTGSPCPSWTQRCAPGWIGDEAGVGPPPPAAPIGARYAFVFVAGKLTRSLGEVDPAGLWVGGGP